MRTPSLPIAFESAGPLESRERGPNGQPLDQRGRPLHDLRISLTDRCNFRCPYCMPRAAFGAEHAFLPRSELLDVEEIVRVVRASMSLGVRKVRLTGGEPLLRPELPQLIALLAALPELELALTTNGSLLAGKARALADAGLSRITVSLDSLDPAVFAAMSDTSTPLAHVLAGIDAAQAAGLTPIKINCVVRRDLNQASILPLARHFKARGITVRFIEYMDVGNTNHWQDADVMSAREIAAHIDAELPIEALPLPARHPGEVAQRYRYRDGSGEVGVIASISEPFCGDCSRARLSANGHLYTCLFANRGTDLRPTLRAAQPSAAGTSDDAALTKLLADLWHAREDRYSERRAELMHNPKVEMSYIGG